MTLTVVRPFVVEVAMGRCAGVMNPSPYGLAVKGFFDKLRAGHARPLQSDKKFIAAGVRGTPDSKVKEGGGALSANSNTAFA